jgi:hypothetical protein
MVLYTYDNYKDNSISNIKSNISAFLNIKSRAPIKYNIASLTFKDAKSSDLIEDSILSAILILGAIYIPRDFLINRRLVKR